MTNADTKEAEVSVCGLPPLPTQAKRINVIRATARTVPFFRHSGIQFASDTIISFGRTGLVRESTSQFFNGRKLVENQGVALTPEMEARAVAFASNPPKFNWLTRNCESYVNYVLTGKTSSASAWLTLLAVLPVGLIAFWLIGKLSKTKK